MSTLNLTFDFLLETDYDGLMLFCEQQHCAETLRFWSDAEDFRKAILAKHDEVQPPPPLPKASLPARATRVLTKSLRKSVMGQRLTLHQQQQPTMYSVPMVSATTATMSTSNTSPSSSFTTGKSGGGANVSPRSSDLSRMSVLSSSLDTLTLASASPRNGGAGQPQPRFSTISVDATPITPRQQQQLQHRRSSSALDIPSTMPSITAQRQHSMLPSHSELSADNPFFAFAALSLPHQDDLPHHQQPHSRDPSTASTLGALPPTPSPAQRAQMGEMQRRLMPMLMTGSSIMKIEMSMTKNLADKLGIGRGDVPWLELAQNIYIKYFDVNSPSQICVSPEIADEVEDNIYSGNITPELFLAAQQAVYHEMKTGLFPLYLQKVWVVVKDMPPAPVPVVDASGASCSGSPPHSYSTNSSGGGN